MLFSNKRKHKVDFERVVKQRNWNLEGAKVSNLRLTMNLKYEKDFGVNGNFGKERLRKWKMFLKLSLELSGGV